MRDTCAPHRNVVKENLEEGSSSGVPSDSTPEGSDGLAAAKAIIGKLAQRKSAENEIDADVA